MRSFQPLVLILLLSTTSIDFVFGLFNRKTVNQSVDHSIFKMPVENVIVAIAMEAEAAPFVEHLELKPDDSIFPSNVPFLAYSGKHGNAQVTVITNGKDKIYSTGVDNCGTVPAAMATFLAMQKLPHTDLLINAGTSGGFARKGAAIGDVFLTTAVAHHDRRIPIPDFVPYGIGKLNSTIVDHTEKLANQHGYKLGVCTTGNSLDMTDEDDKHMMANEASVKDMEAAAIAWSCALHNKTFLGVKVVTDIVDGDKPTQEEFLENLHKASKSLQENLPKVLDYLIGLEHDEL